MTASSNDLARQAALLRERAIEMDRAAELARRQELAAAMRERDARKPKAPDVRHGPQHVSFVRVLQGRAYTYGAVGWSYGGGDGSRWAITASRAPKPSERAMDHGRYTWNGLLEFVGEANWDSITLLRPGATLIRPEDAPAVKETIGDYGRVLGTEQVEPFHGHAGSGAHDYSEGAPY